MTSFGSTSPYATLPPVTKRSIHHVRSLRHDKPLSCPWKWGQRSRAWCPSCKKRKICGTVVLFKILRYSFSCLYLATCPVSKNCINSLESLQMQRKRRERWERSDEISNMALFWSLFTWTSKNTFNLIWLNFNEFCCPKILVSTARRCLFGHFGRGEGLTSRKKARFSIYRKIFQVFSKITRKCYWCNVGFMWGWGQYGKFQDIGTFLSLSVSLDLLVSYILCVIRSDDKQ